MNSRKKGIITLVGIGLFVVAAVGFYVYSSRLENPLLPSSKPQAALSQIKQTEFYVDAFKTDEIDTKKWRIAETGGAKVRQTAANNLRMDLPAGKTNSGANLVFKQLLKDYGDFRVRAVIYKPQITGNGVAVSGIRFNSTGSANDESAFIQWVMNRKSATEVVSRLSFVVTAPDGTRLETEGVSFTGDIAVLRLERINREYRAFYKPGKDLSGDVAWVALGNKKSASLGADGRVMLFTDNRAAVAGADYPGVVGRFDQVNIGWEGIKVPNTRVSFSDAFSNDVVAKTWKVQKTQGSDATERPSDNLVLSVAAGAVAGKPGAVNVRRSNPIVKEGKDFVLQTVIYKPIVTGAGIGQAGLAFASTTKTDDEAAKIFWKVNGEQSSIVFAVRNPDGTLAEQESVSLDPKEKNITLRLVRTGNTYAGWYRTGDLDTDFVKVGNEKSASFGASGNMNLFARNTGVGNNFPKVVARFDQAYGSVER